MPAKLLIAGLVLFGSTLVARHSGTDRHSDSWGGDRVPTELPAQHLPIIREHTYRMAGKIRVLLLWLGRDDVGSGVIKWRANADERAYELLIGSDPQRAPGHLNKWGYLIEHIHDGDSSLVGLISQSHEERLNDVRAGLKAQQDARAFDTVRGLVVSGEAYARVGTLYAAPDLTAREANTVLSQVLKDGSLSVKRITRSNDARGGFLSSIAELIESSLRVGDKARNPAAESVRYVHGDRLFELRMLESTRLPRFELDGRTFDNVIRSRFDTGRAGARSRTWFELIYGTSGALRGIPIVISYQPRWWLQVNLVLQT